MRGVYAFHGSDSKCGVTMVAQSVAQQIARDNPDKDILMISLCKRRNSQFVRKEPVSIDIYRDRIENFISVKKSEMNDKKLSSNLYYLDGIERESDGRIYFPDMTQRFLRSLKDQFDFIILDTGSEMDNGLAVGGLMSSNVNFMVLAQNDASLERYRRLRKLYDCLSFGFDAYVINKFRQRDVYSIDYIRKHIIPAYKPVMTVCDTEKWREAEYLRKTFYDMKDKRFTEDIKQIARFIIEDVNSDMPLAPGTYGERYA